MQMSDSSSSCVGLQMKNTPATSRPAKSPPPLTTFAAADVAVVPIVVDKGKIGRPRKHLMPPSLSDSTCDRDVDDGGGLRGIGSGDMSGDKNGNQICQKGDKERLLHSSSTHQSTLSHRISVDCNSSKKIDRNRDRDILKKPRSMKRKRKGDDNEIEEDDDCSSSSDDGEHAIFVPAVPAVGRVGSWTEL